MQMKQYNEQSLNCYTSDVVCRGIHSYHLSTSSRTIFIAFSFFSLVLRGVGVGPGASTALLGGVELGRELDPGVEGKGEGEDKGAHMRTRTALQSHL